MVIVDNFESVDMLTFSTLISLTERLAGERVSLVVAGDNEHPLVQAFAELHHEMTLPQLSFQDLSGYLHDAFPELSSALVDELVLRVAGSPRNLGLMVEQVRLRLPERAQDLPETALS